jgi:hypothetical protein
MHNLGAPWPGRGKSVLNLTQNPPRRPCNPWSSRLVRTVCSNPMPSIVTSQHPCSCLTPVVFFSCFVRVGFRISAPPYRHPPPANDWQIWSPSSTLVPLAFLQAITCEPGLKLAWHFRHGFQGVSLLHWPVLLLLPPTSLQHSAKFNLRSCKPHDPFSMDTTGQDLVSRRPPIRYATRHGASFPMDL